jgi:hypothetical protein
LNYWERIRGDKILPSWQGLETDELIRISENLAFTDVVPVKGEYRFLIRYQGTKISEACGADSRGKFLDEILRPRLREGALATYRQLLATRQPVYVIVDIADRDGRPVHYERLLLPFGRDNRNVDRILASLETVSPEGAFENRGLMNLPTFKPVFSLCAVINQAPAA